MLKMELGHLKCVNSLFKNGQILPRPRIPQDAQPALIKAELLFFFRTFSVKYYIRNKFPCCHLFTEFKHLKNLNYCEKVS